MLRLLRITIAESPD